MFSAIVFDDAFCKTSNNVEVSGFECVDFAVVFNNTLCETDDSRILRLNLARIQSNDTFCKTDNNGRSRYKGIDKVVWMLFNNTLCETNNFRVAGYRVITEIIWMLFNDTLCNTSDNRLGGDELLPQTIVVDGSFCDTNYNIEVGGFEFKVASVQDTFCDTHNL